MRRFVVPSKRAGVDELIKAWTRGPRAGFKYLKRVPFFSKGKMRWRYFYADEKKLHRGRAHHDPHEEHEHVLISKQGEFHPNLIGKLKATVEVTTTVLRQLLGWEKGTKIGLGGEFQELWVKPHIDNEQAGAAPTRASTMLRIDKALEMLPDYIREMVDPEQVKGTAREYEGLKELTFNTQNEDDYAGFAGGVLGWAQKNTGKLHIMAESFKGSVGSARYGSALTLGESVVWHEFGHHVHYRIEDIATHDPSVKRALSDWQSGLPGNRITEYAYTNWKEDFAETFACAIAHPHELAERCPERYDWMQKHALKEMVDREDLLKMPEEDFHWWESKPNTPASKLLSHLKLNRPAPQFHDYHSDKDQFYTVTKDGRTVYMRIGPHHKDEESGWERMPATTYEETLTGADGKPVSVTLPRHERLLGPRFKKTESIKEVYDENGKPLSDAQAYFFLGQDDEKVIVHAGDTEKFEEYAKKDHETHLLSFKMYTTLGFQKEHDTELKRLKKVVEAQKKWDATKVKPKDKEGNPKPRPDFGLERHEWAPVAIDQHEFIQKTTTFKFGQLRGAKDQPWKALDPETGAVITRYDEGTGKQTPVLTARVYEQENPDGTFTKVSISEAAPFTVGDVILIPGKGGAWRQHTLKRGDYLDPYQLARQHDVTAKELLAKNSRFDRGQIMDPILAALINPHGKPIMDAATLQEMMRDAALDTSVDTVTGRVVGRRAWVTVKSGIRPEDGIGHIQVQFDGAGPPKIVGDYWPRKFGKSEMRIDELLNRKDEIDIPRVIERKAKRVPLAPGALVWFTDPKSERRLLGTLVEKKGNVFRVQARPGQVGAQQKIVSVARVEATSDDLLEEAPSKRIRHVQPLKNDILLYMDEVPRDSGTENIEGVIKILLPVGGDYTLEEVQRWPGVRVLEPREGGLVKQITISPEDLPRLRERMGGFVMDSRVRAKLVDLDERTRALAQEHGKKQIVEAEDFEDADGNINPEGPLGELITGDDGIQPAEHRIRALQKMAKNGGRMYAAHFMGCLSGDTRIPVNRCGRGFSLPIRELYERQNELKGAWDMSHSTYATSVFGDFLRLNEIMQVIDSGEQETFLVRTRHGREIRATAMHPFWTPRGWVSLSDLRTGDRVGVRGAVESNSMSLRRDPAVYAVHHKDGDTFNNAPDNLEVLPHVDHWRKHGEDGGWTNFNQFHVGWDEVEFVGDERVEHTYDISMHVQSQSYVAEDFIVHNTGKTALSIMASEMMRNLKDPETGAPFPNRPEKRTLTIGPPNTVENTFQEHVKFARPPTLLGSSSLANALQIPVMPTRKPNESDARYKTRALDYWKDGLKKHPNWWNPWTDTSKDVICGHEYFRDHEDALALLDEFDGLVIDEAHKVARENQISRAVEKWSPQMKMLLMMSGTPIKNKLDALPRIVDLLTAGEVKLGTAEEFSERYLMPSAVAKSLGSKTPPRTDINPQKVGELAAILQPLMDVATTADVLASGSKTMPAVLLDENEPAHMTGQQARMYRAAVAKLTDAEQELLSESAAVGLDEEHLLSKDAKTKLAVARSIANCPGYKAPDLRENIIYKTKIVEKTKDGKLREREVARVFKLPTISEMTKKRPGGWGGKWPDAKDVEAGIVNDGYLRALEIYMDRILGVSYEVLAGKKIDPGLIKDIQKEGFTTASGEPWGSEGGMLKNPDHGPEGMICRGELDQVSGEIKPLKATYFDSLSGESHDIVVPVGVRFIRDYRSKQTGFYYHEDDWSFTGRFKDEGETGDEPGGAEDVEAMVRPTKGQQAPKPGHEGYTIQRSPHRRKERAMFDLVTTHNNAKCDKMEQNMRNIFKEKHGSGASAQMIIFGNRVGSSVRTAEAKLRTLGYMDVNEALGHAEISTTEDKRRALGTRKFFATYMGKGATLGDRDINSEIFRRQQDAFGKDTGISMFVWRTMYGTHKYKYLSHGKMEEPWSRSHRRRIAKTFVDGSGRETKSGAPAGLETPMRVVGWKDKKTGELGQRYIYESDVPSKVRGQVIDLEVRVRSQRGEAEATSMARISELLMPYASERKPLTDAQMDIFNNCQLMVASDAANVGLNWPCEHLTMYDSLFSPMEEWQRITRAARMLPPSIRGAAKPLVEKIGKYINEQEAKADFKEYEGVDSAMLIVNEAIQNGLTDGERLELNDLPGGAPDQIVEAWFAKRAFDKIASLREEVGVKLRNEGAVPDPTKPPGEGNFIPPVAIQESDVMNEILRQHLTPFDRQILKSRRYLVDVKRLTVSADMPIFKEVTTQDPVTGKAIKVRVATGEYETESPVKAERSQLAQGRAKMVPYEYFLKIVQSAQPLHTKYDYIDAQVGSVAAFSEMPEGYTAPGPSGLPPAKKSQFYVPLGAA